MKACVSIAGLFLILAISSCAPRHHVKMNSGYDYKAVGPVELDPETGEYEFVNEDGKKMRVRKENVTAIEER